MSSPIAEIVSGAATHVLHIARGPQRPYGEKSKNPEFRKTTKVRKYGPVYSYGTAYFPLKWEPCNDLLCAASWPWCGAAQERKRWPEKENTS